jgi:hypothetical protein
MLLRLLLALLLAATPRLAAAQNIPAQLEGAVNRVADVLGETFGRSLPLPSASAGVSYTFNPETGSFQREPSTFGQVYLDRADTLGAKRLNASFTYQYVKLDELDGKPADDLRDPTPIYVPGKALAILFPRLNLDAAVHQFLFAVTYGFTENLEASVAVPIMYSDLRVGATVRAAGISASDGSLLTSRVDIDDAQRVVGVGDVLLRAKYRVLDSGPVHVAGALFLRLPSGDEGDLQGIGFFEVSPTLLASTRIFEPASWARLQVHLNAGVGFDTEDVNASEARWGIGLDWGVTKHITAAVAVLGRNQFARVAPAGAFSFPRCPGASLVTCASDASVRNGSAPLFGLSTGRPDYYDVSVGGRAALWRDTVFAFVNLVIPLNDGFVRTAPIPLIGVEATF